MNVEFQWDTVKDCDVCEFVPRFPEMATGQYVTVLQYRVDGGEWKVVPHAWSPPR